MKPILLIAIDGGGRALAVAKVTDPNLLRLAAGAAIAQKRDEAHRAAATDGTLAMVAREEADRLERTLSQLIPSLTAAPAAVH